MCVRGCRVCLVVVGAAGLLAWYIGREPARRGYLGNIVRQIPHLPGRYAV